MSLLTVLDPKSLDLNDVHSFSDNARALTLSFELLAKGHDNDETILSILQFAGSYHKVDRAYIYEKNSDGTLSITYEWCKSGIESLSPEHNNIPMSPFYERLLEDKYNATAMAYLPGFERDELIRHGIKAFATYPFMIEGQKVGFVGFDNCIEEYAWNDEDILMLRLFADTFGLLIDRRNKAKSIQYSYDVMRTITDNTDIQVFVVDIYTRELLFVNHTIANQMGMRPQEILDTYKTCRAAFDDVLCHHAENCPLQIMVNAKERRVLLNKRNWEVQNSQSGKWYLVRNTIVKWMDGRDVLIETMMDITRQKEYELQLEYIASRDSMTGTYNREWGNRFIEGSINSASGTHTVTFIDIDGLKHVNDRHGHRAGDFLILKIVDIIKQCIRKADVLCRWGGDEFLLITPGSKETALIAIERIKVQLENYNRTSQVPYNMDFSYGMSEINAKENQTLDSVVSEADHNMYENKVLKRAINIHNGQY